MDEVKKPNVSNRPPGKSRRLRWLVAVPILIAVAGFAVLSIPDFRATLFGTAAQHANCARTRGTAGIATATSQTSAANGISAKLVRDQRTEVDFGRSLTARAVVLYLDLNAAPAVGPALFQVRANPFVRSDDASLRQQDIFASARRDGKTLILNVCFIRDGNPATNLGNPGSYLGSVTIDDSRLSAPVSVPIIVTMQYTNGVFLLWLYFLAVLPGAWCVWVIREKVDGHKPALSLDFIEWVFTINGLVSVVAGSVAAFAVYVAVYLRDPTWGSSALQPLTLYGGMFSAFVTTSGLASLTGKKTEGLESRR